MAPAVTRLVCRFPNCNRVFKNKSGLTQHTNMKHSTQQIQRDLNRTTPLAGPRFIPPRSCSPTPAGENQVIDENFHQDAAGEQEDGGFVPEEGTRVDNQDAAGEQEDGGFVPEEGTWVDMGRLFRTFHPHLTGLKCDANRSFIDHDAPPLPHTDAPPTDWTPYND
ncbi:hypothetical protein C8R48DRAFT_771765 [Suillus tomentosus]|nr:hypothetical protein C8R48DRAFT_771765 [Suillus tomentosus]